MVEKGARILLNFDMDERDWVWWESERSDGFDRA